MNPEENRRSLKDHYNVFGGSDYSAVECSRSDLVQRDDGVSALQFTLFQKFLSGYLKMNMHGSTTTQCMRRETFQESINKRIIYLLLP